MATAPMMMDQSPEYAESEMGVEDDYSGYEICIRVDAKGMLSVGVENDSTPQADGLEGDEDKSGYMPAENIREALTMALDMYRERSGNEGDAESEDVFSSAFKQARGVK